MTEPTPPAVPLTYKQEAMLALKDWQADIATDRGVNPTEANGALLYQINNVINALEAI